jgi:hypothetical protein
VLPVTQKGIKPSCVLRPEETVCPALHLVLSPVIDDLEICFT